MSDELYFAFGSNLDINQMTRRCPSSQVVAKATLPGYKLVFRGRSYTWGGAVASVDREPGRFTEGLVYQMSSSDLLRLDGFEGRAYARTMMTVHGRRRRRLRAWVYAMDPSVSAAAPSARYLATIQCAYAELGFDQGALPEAHEDAPAAGGELEECSIDEELPDELSHDEILKLTRRRFR